MMHGNIFARMAGILFICLCPVMSMASERGVFDMDRWDTILENVRTRAAAQNISQKTAREDSGNGCGRKNGRTVRASEILN